ncbi:hypothetical protein FB470_000873 [Amycolatopsis thermophila]|uniref:Uncharacterized protein n=1 Tax=Amycolatopsis thermophila TaxID=206084 RepID=A0ABU0ENK1_9PSEU|nr:hypothetical protein [Amycolatopsis thermophila]
MLPELAAPAGVLSLLAHARLGCCRCSPHSAGVLS